MTRTTFFRPYTVGGPFIAQLLARWYREGRIANMRVLHANRKFQKASHDGLTR